MARRKHRSFDTLLRVRERQEHIKAQALAAVRREIRVHEGQREALRGEQARMFSEAASRTKTTFSAGNVQGYYLYERHLSRVAVEEDATIRHLRKVEEERRQELEEAMKRKRVVERLQEKAVQDHLAALRKNEQKVSDELAANKAAFEKAGDSRS